MDNEVDYIIHVRSSPRLSMFCLPACEESWGRRTTHAIPIHYTGLLSSWTNTCNTNHYTGLLSSWTNTCNTNHYTGLLSSWTNTCNTNPLYRAAFLVDQHIECVVRCVVPLLFPLLSPLKDTVLD